MGFLSAVSSRGRKKSKITSWQRLVRHQNQIMWGNLKMLRPANKLSLARLIFRGRLREWRRVGNKARCRPWGTFGHKALVSLSDYSAFIGGDKSYAAFFPYFAFRGTKYLYRQYDRTLKDKA